MDFPVPGMNDQPLPAEFAGLAAYGDLVSGILALLAIIDLRSRWCAALPLVWIFNVLGTDDLANAVRHLDAVPRFGASWFIQGMLVPLLLVTHFLIFKRLLVRGR